jgi:hypothetical protein
VGGSISEGPGIDLVGSQIGLGGDTILLYASNGDPVAEFDPDSAGLDSAIAAASSYDTIFIPSVEIGGNHTLPNQITLKGIGPQTRLTGTITGGTDTEVNFITFKQEVNNANTLKALIGPSSGFFSVADCVVDLQQSGSGDVQAISNAGSGFIQLYRSYIHVSSIGGIAYAIYQNSGNPMWFYWNQFSLGSNARLTREA